MGKFCFCQSVRKLLEKQGKMLFYKTYVEKCNIIWKQHISYKDKNIKKFGKKN